MGHRTAQAGFWTGIAAAVPRIASSLTLKDMAKIVWPYKGDWNADTSDRAVN